MGTVGEEQRLRLLLDRTIPRPPDPADRMHRVYGRMVRRRRRRRVVKAALGVFVLATVTVAVRGALGDRSAGPVVRAAPVRTGAGAEATTEAGQYPSSVRKFPDLFGLTLTMPNGWRTADATDARSQAAGIAYVRSTPGKKNSPTCVPDSGVTLPCTSAFTVREDGALISFEQSSDHPVGDGSVTFAVGEVTAAGPECRGVGADHELTGWGSAPAGGGRPAVNARACLHDPSAETLAQVKAILNTADFPGG